MLSTANTVKNFWDSKTMSTSIRRFVTLERHEVKSLGVNTFLVVAIKDAISIQVGTETIYPGDHITEKCAEELTQIRGVVVNTMCEPTCPHKELLAEVKQISAWLGRFTQTYFNGKPAIKK